ncbi:hypothetical protein AALO_G00281200 [Alosa alosa]|uniref:Uncharacterized protein n=1 Tax=Alosa alosa TaxID=278164 RepID=A0AAV6FJU9_9TELE|nr:protachykinin-1 [Alosa alosa]XP_048088464.1 protachykinin-1 [Alosa alosa]KAG5262988.1 hypothetical protein AALO_G00281200 [Alosa alosa]
METWKLLATFMLLIALVYSAQGISLTLDRDNWISKDWQEEPVLEQLAEQEESLMKRSKARQFYGLMGKRSATSSQRPAPVQRRGHKGAVFIGLMGRRDAVSEGQRAGALRRITPEEDTSSAADMMEESNQHLDLEEDWNKHLYY